MASCCHYTGFLMVMGMCNLSTCAIFLHLHMHVMVGSCPITNLSLPLCCLFSYSACSVLTVMSANTVARTYTCAGIFSYCACCDVIHMAPRSHTCVGVEVQTGHYHACLGSCRLIVGSLAGVTGHPTDLPFKGQFIAWVYCKTIPCMLGILFHSDARQKHDRFTHACAEQNKHPKFLSS